MAFENLALRDTDQLLELFYKAADGLDVVAKKMCTTDSKELRIKYRDICSHIGKIMTDIDRLLRETGSQRRKISINAMRFMYGTNVKDYKLDF